MFVQLKSQNMKSTITGIFALAFIFGLSACSTTEESATLDKNAVGAEELQKQPAAIKHISAAEFDKVKSETKAIVIDVRTPGEVAEGYIDGADLFIDVNGNSFQSEIAKLDKSANYIVYCRSGARSMNASNYMVEQGFTNVYNLDGGIMRWNGKVVK
jgi:rhodanese-related sulfurtransferase